MLRVILAFHNLNEEREKSYGNDHTSVRKNFTLTNVVALSKYLKGFTPKIEKR